MFNSEMSIRDQDNYLHMTGFFLSKILANWYEKFYSHPSLLGSAHSQIVAAPRCKCKVHVSKQYLVPPPLSVYGRSDRAGQDYLHLPNQFQKTYKPNNGVICCWRNYAGLKKGDLRPSLKLTGSWPSRFIPRFYKFGSWCFRFYLFNCMTGS